MAPSIHLDGVPDGYVEVEMPDDRTCLVPTFLLPDTHQAFDAYHKKVDENVFMAKATVSMLFRDRR